MNFFESTNCEIFEIQAITSQDSFLIRQKRSVSLLKFVDDNLICDNILLSPDIPFITTSSVLDNRQILATGNLNKVVQLWDLNNSKTPKQTFQPKLKYADSKQWNCLRNFNQNTFAFAGLREFSLLDSRQSQSNSINSFSNFGKYNAMCEDISSLAKSNYDNIFYVATTHKLFSIDIRFLHKEIDNNCIIQKWTHQMHSVPLMLKTYKLNENYELIAMSSLLSGDLRICENFCKFENDLQFTSPSLPFKPVSLLDGFKTAKKFGECLDPVKSVESRCTSCITGLDFLIKSDTLNLVSSNSLGDVFITKLNFDEDNKYSENFNKKIFLEYNQKVNNEMAAKPLNITDNVKLQGICHVLRCKHFSKSKTNLFVNVIADDEPKPFIRKAKWEKNIEELSSFKDVLASNLLSIWNIIDFTKEEHFLPSKNKQNIEEKDKNKVKNWLNCNKDMFDVLPLDNTNKQPMTQVHFDEHIQIDTNRDLTATFSNISTINDGLFNKKASIEKKSIPKIKQKSYISYVKGF